MMLPDVCLSVLHLSRVYRA